MEFPKDEKIRFKLLEFAKDGQIHSIQDAEDYLAKEFKITEEQRRKEKRTGHETLFLHKIRWCRTHLRIADLISDPKKAHYQITALGEKCLEDNSNLKEITTQTLMKYKKFQAWKKENDELKKKKKSNKKAKEGNGIVIMIDALGTKKILDRMSGKRVTATWRNFTTDLENKISVEISSYGEYTFHSFSDTIMIAIITKKIEEVLYKVSRILTKFIIESMVIDRPIRGCISVGSIIMDDIQVVGNAIEESAKYYELPQWIGISACPSAHRVIEKLQEKNLKKTDSYFQSFDLPLRNSVELGALAVNWTEPANEDFLYFVNEHRKSDFKNMNIYEFFRKSSENILDLGIALKWRNTIKFFTDVRK